MKIRILAQGFEHYTGHFGTVAFEDGVSEEISGPDAQRMGSIMHVEVVGTGENPSVTQMLVDTRNRNLEEIGETKTLAQLDEEAKAAARANKQSADKAESQPKHSAGQTEAPSVDPATLDYSYTKEDLGALVAKQGIAGLRAFSEPYGIKGRSVRTIIEDMLALKDTFAKPKAAVIEDEDDGMELVEETPVPQASPQDTISTGAVDFVAPAADVPEGTEIVEDTDDLDAELAALTDGKE